MGGKVNESTTASLFATFTSSSSAHPSRRPTRRNFRPNLGYECIGQPFNKACVYQLQFDALLNSITGHSMPLSFLSFSPLHLPQLRESFLCEDASAGFYLGSRCKWHPKIASMSTKVTWIFSGPRDTRSSKTIWWHQSKKNISLLTQPIVNVTLGCRRPK